MSQLVAVSAPTSGREMIERAAMRRRAFYPNGLQPRIKIDRIPWRIVYAAPIVIPRVIPPDRPVYVEPELTPAEDLAEEARNIAAMMGKRVRVIDIICAVGDHFGVAKTDLISDRRSWAISRPRQVVMYLSKELTIRSLPEIGRLLGGKDHTTILHGCRKIAAMIAAGDPIAADVKTIREKLT